MLRSYKRASSSREGSASVPEISSEVSTSARIWAANGTVMLRCWSSAAASSRATASRSGGGAARQPMHQPFLHRLRQPQLPIGKQPGQQRPQQRVLRRADLDRGHGAQPAGEVGQTHGPARRRRAGGEQDRQPCLARCVQQMQQRPLVADGIGIVERDAVRRDVRQAATARRRRAPPHRCVAPRCAADGSCRSPPRPTAPADGPAIRGVRRSQAQASALEAAWRKSPSAKRGARKIDRVSWPDSAPKHSGPPTVRSQAAVSCARRAASVDRGSSCRLRRPPGTGR